MVELFERVKPVVWKHTLCFTNDFWKFIHRRVNRIRICAVVMNKFRETRRHELKRVDEPEWNSIFFLQSEAQVLFRCLRNDINLIRCRIVKTQLNGSLQ